MKVALLIIVGILFWTSTDAREFTADQLNNCWRLSDLILTRTPSQSPSDIVSYLQSSPLV